MGKFESYPEADSLNDSDITLYNKNSVTHKITFSRLVSLIKNKIAATGLVTSITTGVGLVSGTITSSGLIKCKLKSETPSSLSSTTISTTANRQYAVGVDKEGNLSVNVPWQENYAYQNGTAINIVNDTINVVLDDTYTSTSTVKAATANAVRKTYINSMRTDGSNADTHVHFSNSLTVGVINSNNPVNIGNHSVCFGYENTISGDSALASGVYTEASGFASHSEGRGTDETNYVEDAPQEYYAQATANIVAHGVGSHVEGYADYEGQTSITGIIQANGNGSHAEGCAIAGQGDSGIIAYGLGSHAEGYTDSDTFGTNCYTIAKGNGSHAEGMGTHAEGDFSHAEGRGTVASGERSHAEGGNTKANSIGSHAEGIGTTSSSTGSHAEGGNTTASGTYSHAEGCYTTASASYSHGEGYNTTASGKYSHAEGFQAIASSDYSHAEGFHTTSNALYAHAEGYITKASGSCSHAGGAYVTAAQKCQLAQGGIDGKFNSVDDYGRGVFCVSPNTLHYDTNSTIYFPNGISITADGGVSLTIELNKYSMYVLYWVAYSGENDSVINAGIHYITTSKDTNNPLVQDILPNNIIDSVSPCAITLLDSNKYMFHLMRIL